MLGTGEGPFAGFQMVNFSYGTQDKERVNVSFPKLPRAIISSQESMPISKLPAKGPISKHYSARASICELRKVYMKAQRIYFKNSLYS